MRLRIGIAAAAPILMAVLSLSTVGCSDSQSEDSLPPLTSPTPVASSSPLFSPTRTPSARDLPLEQWLSESRISPTPAPVTPFTDIAAEALKGGVNHERQLYQVWNDRPGVAIFDFDRDGDQDFYLTSDGKHPNWLYRNEGDGTFTDVADEAGVGIKDSHSTGVAACDINNDGYQDLYVSAWGNPLDFLDFRSPLQKQGIIDSLFLNNGDGTFEDITESAFGDAVNIRSSMGVTCADVDGDGWLDFYVGNLMANDFRYFGEPSFPGHVNMLYMNNGDLTFREIGEEAGVRGTQLIMRDLDGKPVLFEDPETGEVYQGYDPNFKDKLGNSVGEPTGQAHAVMFFDFDDDRDPDIWVANDGSPLYVFRNDSTPGNVKFTSVARAMNLEKVGAWMAFSVGDYDGDMDLDVFVANIGFHPREQEAKITPRGACDYHMRFTWGTCNHFLLRNDGMREVEGYGPVVNYKNVAPSTQIIPSPWLPTLGLDPARIHPDQDVPTGLDAYEFGFGNVFFDYDNDGDQDLYWHGSIIGRGESPGGKIYPGPGRLFRGDGKGGFEDVSVRARVLDIVGVDYEGLEDEPLPPDPEMMKERRIHVYFHENGKGLAAGDLNGDGYVDLIAANSSGDQFTKPLIVTVPTQMVAGQTFVWINGGGDNHWLTLRLQGRMAIDGTGSNADGIGARVYVKTTPKGAVEPHVQLQELHTGSSYLSMHSIELEFGVGSATAVDEILIIWPSGRIQTLENVEVDQYLIVTEPES